MNRSPYIDNVVLTSKHSGKRTEKVQAFVIHHMAAKWTGKRCAEYFRDTAGREASANYCIGYDGDVALNVEEENRAWTSSSNWADQRAITYELANSKTGEPWEVSDATIRKAIVMLAEQHKRYGLKKATYTGDTSGTLWRHDWFAKTNCPGTYLGGKFAYIAQEVNKLLDVKTPIVSGAKSYKLVTTVNGYINAGDAKAKKNAKTKVKAGNYTVFSEANGMINVTTKAGLPGNWINPADNKKTATTVNNKGFSISGEAHVQSKGWMSMKNNILGTTGKGLRLEAFNVTVSKDGKLLPISGMVHLQSLGDVKVNTNLFGTVGEKRRLEAVKLNIHANIEYRVHMQYGGWSAWTKNNEWAGSKGKERRIEAIEFRVK